MEETKQENPTDEKEILPEPKQVKYCELCHFPIEYCEYSHSIVLKKVGDVQEQKEEKKEEEVVKEEKKEETEKEDTKDKEKEKKQKKKKEAANTVLIEQTKRGKKKHITYITNLDKFGYVLKDISKMFSKKFACSCTVTKEDNGTECITLTGEFADEVYDYIIDNLTNVKAENIMVKKK